MSPRIGLNLIYLVPGETGGMESYADHLIRALLDSGYPGLELTTFVNRELREASPKPWAEAVRVVEVPVGARRRTEWVRGEQQLLPRLAAKAKVELVHSLGNTAPAWGRFRRVVTIHDLIHRIHPEAHFGNISTAMKWLVRIAIHRSDRVIVPSVNTRTDLIRLGGVSEDLIDVVPQGVAPPPAIPETTIAETRNRFHLRDLPVVLSASAKRPHKNLPRLLEALALLPSERRPMLVLPGYPTPHEEELRRQAKALDIEDRTRFLGWISEQELEGLYATASAFVFPSLYEGFGLPVLEAMIRGVPVACSDGGSLGEVAGDAAKLFDPQVPAEIAAAIEALLSDPAEAQRLREAGLSRAKRYTWATTAEGTLTSYRRALEIP